MASPLITRSPQCISCLRRTVAGLGERRLFPAGQQIRGKKYAPKGTNKVNALLLKDVKGYGKKGTVMSVAPGVMRNQWYPRKLAEYVTDARLAELGLKKEDIVERGNIQTAEEAVSSTMQAEADSDAGTTANDPLATLDPIQEPVEPVEPAAPEPLTPEQATSILTRLLVPTVEFHRTPIPTSHLAPKKLSPSLPANAAVSGSGRGAQIPQNASIYGSVSTADIAADINTILAGNEEGAGIILSPEDISFVKEAEEKDRIKHLGTFEIDIRLRGAPSAIRRTIKVSALA
ncbi:uncharacterized protein BP5553_02202 [Venustampulla echinocandica]|uniref:Ribosomal protein L9 domain-containing protein n=1 Tax=Venustampulla echinocandica TaxID=2656787 RepID=A0A370U3B4_9HELO|nr:uncharacterized protein BP5553_02202 [Venustampulla echinocandica]RDL42223.1 hypothetical protein BP5553_02202 [Venustampulla echinocandica]